jgi:hypothetical protein
MTKQTQGRSRKRAKAPAAPRAAAWLGIRVELAGRRGTTFPRPAGRIFAASPTHSFAILARQIDIAFARWDLGHLHEFELAGGDRIGPIDEDADDAVLDEERVKLSRLKAGDTFTYTFDFGDMWVHRCIVENDPIDPLAIFGVAPSHPTACFGWGSIPDQYGRNKPDD